MHENRPSRQSCAQTKGRSPSPGAEAQSVAWLNCLVGANEAYPILFEEGGKRDILEFVASLRGVVPDPIADHLERQAADLWQRLP